MKTDAWSSWFCSIASSAFLLPCALAFSCNSIAAESKSDNPATSPEAQAKAINLQWTNQPLAKVREAAEQGDSGAQYVLGRFYYLGQGVPKDVAIARNWFQRAAEQGLAVAQFNCGLLSGNEGLIGNQYVGNYPVAAEWYEKAAAQGYVRAMVSLGNLYFYSRLKADYSEAAKWYRKAAQAGNVEAAEHLGRLYLYNHEDFKQDHAEAMRWLRIAAEKNNADAQFELSELLLRGEGVPHDKIESEQWLQRAAANGSGAAAQQIVEQGHAAGTLNNLSRDQLEKYVQAGAVAARLTLAIDYDEGRLGAPNPYRAAGLYWMILVEIHGPQKDRPEAHKRLVALYTNGRVKLVRAQELEKLDPPTGGLRYYSSFAAKTPDRLAQFLYSSAKVDDSPELAWQVGEMFYRGDLLPEDWGKAVDCYWRAAQAGYPKAFNKLGELWAAGVNGQPDFKEAVRWYRRAATNGLALAQLNLGRAFRDGAGVDGNVPEAWCWLRLAAEQANDAAGAELKALEANMSETQHEQALERFKQVRALSPLKADK